MPTKVKKRKSPKKSKASLPKVPAKLSPETTPPEPGRMTYVYLPKSSTSGINVTEQTADTYAAVWACKKVISEDIATLPWRVFKERTDGGADIQPFHPVDWLTHKQASPEMSAYHFKETIVNHALGWGNGYAEIERDMLGRPAWLWLLTPDRVEVDRDENGNLIYDVWNYGAPNTVLDAADVFHLKGLGFDGLVGYSVISMAARVIGRGLAIDQHGSDFWANDSTPGGVLTHPKTLQDTARQNLRETWNRTHQGPGRRRTMAILEEGMEFQQTALSKEDAQFIETHHLSIEDVCRFFRVPPHKIQHLLRSTNNNIEHQSIEYGVDTLMPWVTRIESEGNIKLFGRQQRGVFVAKLNMKKRLRGDTAAQTAHIQQMMDRAVYSVNDALDYLDENPIGPQGNTRFVQANMVTLEQAIEGPPEPAPAPNVQPDTKPEDEPEDDNDEAEQMSAACMPVIVDACGRLLRAQRHWATDASKREDYRERLADFASGQTERVAKTLSTALSPLASLAGCSETLMSVLVETQARTASKAFIQRAEKPEAADTWADGAQAWAKELSHAVIRLGKLKGNTTNG